MKVGLRNTNGVDLSKPQTISMSPSLKVMETWVVPRPDSRPALFAPRLRSR